MILLFHILTGAIALIAGTIAFSAKKGSMLHRKSGLVFVINMLVMASTGGLLAIFNNEHLNTLAAGLTFYLVVTGYLAVKTLRQNSRLIHFGLALLALTVAIFGYVIGIDLVNKGADTIDGNPVQVLFIFASVAFLAALFDVKTLLQNLNSKQRLLRHIWRMGFAMFIAVASFFPGQAQVFPEFMRTIEVLLPPVLASILITIFWYVKVSFRGLK